MGGMRSYSYSGGGVLNALELLDALTRNRGEERSAVIQSSNHLPSFHLFPLMASPALGHRGLEPIPPDTEQQCAAPRTCCQFIPRTKWKKGTEEQQRRDPSLRANADQTKKQTANRLGESLIVVQLSDLHL